MSLLEERWMPVRLRNGSHTYISPLDLSRPDLVAFDAERPDFNGALTQFSVSVLSSTSPVDSPRQWQAYYRDPPDATVLRQWFMPHANAFVLDGNGARFMQDLELRAEDGEPIGIAGLLIDSPGENSLRNNGDLFIKRGRVRRLCPHCATMALLTLQINAPSGGAGHRTSLRGGGPLTTLLVVPPSPDGSSSLWQTLWLNVQQRRYLLANGGDENKAAPHFTYPWLAPIGEIQKEGGQVAPIQVHPAHVFWAMPRRIRLDFEATERGQCDLCGRESEQLLTRYLTRNYGLNYKGAWKHPLSPYYEAKDGWLPLHPQSGGIGYRHWLGWVLGMQDDRRKLEAASVVSRFLSDGLERKTGTELRLWAFGYDMDNMKARCWYEASLPLYALGECSPEAREELREDVSDWLAGAELAASLLRGAVKDGWFSGEARGDFSFVDGSFWSRTESDFYALLRERIVVSRDGQTWDRLVGSERWLDVLERVALDLFDNRFIGTGPVERQNPARISQAYRLLKLGLRGPRMRVALGLPAPDNGQRKQGRKTAKAD
jgi:CRISPR system Cascade subunit CasA